nr:hypothetical protein [Kibdelosporangium sp. MJ126-NF4]CEL22510.1 hypothetical protein [Kibdelosporangium sp. MJ126-NF4]CTQ89366.1 hypothetical protein [Kibdelosporangium sp. MJ126-NF4]
MLVLLVVTGFLAIVVGDFLRDSFHGENDELGDEVAGRPGGH